MTNEQIDRLIAEKIFGWKWYHDKFTYRAGEDCWTETRSVLCSPEKFASFEAKYGKSQERGDGAVDDSMCPHPSTNPADDYAVLCHVREKLATPEWEGVKWWEYEDALKRIWMRRFARAVPHLRRTLSAWVAWHLQYEPGDYSRAALAALGIEVTP